MVKVKWEIILIFIISVFAACFKGDRILYIISCGLFSVVVFGTIYLLFIHKNIKINVQCCQQKCQVGEEFILKYEVHKRSIIPVIYLFIKDTALELLNGDYKGDGVSLLFMNKEVIKNKVILNKHGVFNIGEFKVSISDMFNIFKLTKKQKIDKIIKVYPKVYDFNDLNFRGKDIYERNLFMQGKNEDNSIIKDIKKYADGDDIKKIHWKLSAKYGELFVKNYECCSGKDIYLFLDMASEDFCSLKDDLEEKFLSLSASSVKHFLDDNVKVNLFINNGDSGSKEERVIRTLNDFQEFMEFLLNSKCEQFGDIGEYIEKNIKILSKQITIAILVPVLKQQSVDMLIKLKEAGYKIAVFYIKAEEYIETSRLSNSGIKPFMFRSSSINSEKVS